MIKTKPMQNHAGNVATFAEGSIITIPDAIGSSYNFAKPSFE